MASARRTVVLPPLPASPGAAAAQSWSARPKPTSEPRSGLLSAVDEAAPKTAPARLSAGYLAAARQAAAAARARTESIRAAEQARLAMSAAKRSPERRAAHPPGAAPAAGPRVAGAAVAADRRGLSVAEAAQASPIGFRPLRRSPDPALRPADVIGAGSPGAPPAPPAGTLSPGVTPKQAEQQRFAKTIAELERYQVASRWAEPGGGVVPRHPLAPSDHRDAATSPWSRLWTRRKDPAQE